MTAKTIITRPPIVTVMGHIDHGKSTLLDFIRKTNSVDGEAGGITQHLSAYEVVHTTKEKKVHKITFLDTPGHEAFGGIRARGARIADIGVLVVSAEDGVKPQTLEALRILRADSIPFVVAINKIDKQGADVERTKQNLAENDIYLEGYGGTIPWTAISAKNGYGVHELLDLILLVAELEDLQADSALQAKGLIIESNLDTKKGIATTAIITEGTLIKGEFAVSGSSISPLRIVEDFLGRQIDTATFSSPVVIIGWDTMPAVGGEFTCYKTKKEAQEATLAFTSGKVNPAHVREKNDPTKTVIPIILKTDTAGSLDALVYEISKIGNDRVIVKVVLSGIGPLTENDVRAASNDVNALLVSFHTKVEPHAESLALHSGIKINAFDIIYKLTEWLETAVKERTPSIEVEEMVGRSKILKTFSKTKDKQIVGGRVEEGAISVNENVRIMRRDALIGTGRVRELQEKKQKTSTVQEGNEFGSMIESKIELAPGDRIESFTFVKK